MSDLGCWDSKHTPTTPHLAGKVFYIKKNDDVKNVERKRDAYEKRPPWPQGLVLPTLHMHKMKLSTQDGGSKLETVFSFHAHSTLEATVEMVR